MRNLVRMLATVVMALPLSVTQVAGQIDVRTGDLGVRVGGRLHMQFNTTSVTGQNSSEFLLRRARITTDITLNEFISARLQPEYAITSVRIRDAYIRLHFDPAFRFTVGQFKRPFDLFALTSSTQSLVIERTGLVLGVNECAGVRFCSYGAFSALLLLSDRDQGVLLDGQVNSVDYGFSITNGTGAFVDEENGTKSYTGRVGLRVAETVKVAANIAIHDFRNDLTSNDEYAPVLGADVEIGSFAQNGLHLQAGVLGGQNWRNLNSTGDASTFVTAQGIVAYKTPLRGKYVTAVEPIARLSWGDPDTGASDDAAILFTPGVQLFFVGRNKMSTNVDVYVPDQGTTEWSLTMQMYLYF